MSTPPTDPEALRAEIAQTRADLGDTVEALAAKTDVKARARETAGHVVDQAKETVTVVRDRAAELAGGAGARVRSAAVSARGTLADADVPATVRKPLPLAVLGAIASAVGALIWLLRRHRS